MSNWKYISVRKTVGCFGNNPALGFENTAYIQNFNKKYRLDSVERNPR